MIKYRTSIEAVILVWLAFLILLGVGLFVVIMDKWNFVDSIILCSVLVLPTILLFPLVYQSIKFNDIKISLCFGAITFRTFLWSEVSDIGIGYTRAGYGTYKKFIYISKRPLTNKERFNLGGVKVRKNIITFENRGHIIEDIKKYSKLPFRDLPTTEDFNNM